MPWCPKCKNEYYEGFTICADCKVPLVASLEEEVQEMEEEEVYEPMWEQPEEVVMDDDERTPEENEALLNEIMDNIVENTDSDEEIFDTKVYQNYSERAQENKSSAVSLIMIGALGLIAVCLCYFDVLPFLQNVSNKFMMLGVMGTLFLLFLIMGIVSAKNAKKYAAASAGEEKMTGDIKNYISLNLNSEAIDAELFSDLPEELSEEEKYFKRFQYMKRSIAEQFPDASGKYLDRLVDEEFEKVFPGV